ncbi:hypothetical protein JCM11641_000719 [Rhodosporidiobolus odoratus]
MTSLNSALASLGAFNKSGFRVSTSSGPAGSVASTPTSARPPSTSRGSARSPGLAAGGTTREKVEAVAQDASRALSELRKLVQDGVLDKKKVEVEKAAGSVVAGLVEMELYPFALRELSLLRASLVSWWSPSIAPSIPPPTSRPTAYLSLLFVPLPASSYLAPPTLSETLSTSSPSRPTFAEITPLVLATQQYFLACFFRLPPSDLNPLERAAGLARLFREDVGGGSPGDWKTLLDQQAKAGSLDELKDQDREALGKRVDGMMLNMFGSVTKGCAGNDGSVDPEALLTLRIEALLLYLSLSTLSSHSSSIAPSCPISLVPQEKVDALHDQHRKILLLYGRAAEALGRSEAELGERVKACWERFVAACTARGIRREGKKWEETGEVVVHIARRAGDHAFLSRLPALLHPDASDPSSSSNLPDNPNEVAATISRLTTSFLNHLAIFESYAKSPSSSSSTPAVTEALRALCGLIPSLTPLRLSQTPVLPTEAQEKLDKALDRARYSFSKHLKRGKRAEQLLVPAGSTAASLPDIEYAVRKALAGFVGHSRQMVEALRREDRQEEADGQARAKARRDLATTTVDSLLLLAYSTTVVDDRDSLAVAFHCLEQAVPLISPSNSSSQPPTADTLPLDLDLHYSIRTLASAYYNIGGTLFNSGLAGEAGRFVTRACEITASALSAARNSGLLSAGAEGEHDGLAEKLGEMALEDGGAEGKKEMEKREALRDLERLMGRRWELRALAAHAVGDKKAACEAYLSSALSQPPSIYAALTSSGFSSSLSDILIAHAPLYKLLQRSTRLAIFDLLLPAASLPLTCSQLATSVPPAVCGIMLEMQLSTLESCGDKPEVRQAALAMLDEAQKVYTREKFPIRRARILLRRLEIASTGFGASRGLEPQSVAAEIEALCASDLSATADAALAPFCPQLLSLSHLFLAFLAFHAHAVSSSTSAPSSATTSAPSSATSEAIAFQARPALDILQRAMEGDLPSSPTAPPPAPGSGRKPTPKAALDGKMTRTVSFQSPTKLRSPPTAALARPGPAPPPTTRTRRTTTRAAAPPPLASAAARAAPTRRTTRAAPAFVTGQVTPPRRKRGEVKLDNLSAPAVEEKAGQEKVTIAPKTPVKQGAGASMDGGRKEVKLDDVEKVYNLFETASHLLLTLGHQILAISILRFLRRLSTLLPPSQALDAFLTSSARLAKEYLRLGKTARAGVVLAQAEARAKEAEGVSEAEVEVESGRAEYWAMLGGHEKAAAAYDSALKLNEELEKEESTAVTTTAKIVERTLLLRRAGLAASTCSVLLQRKGELSRSLAPALQAMRLRSRALNNISRLAPAPAKGSTSSADDAAFQAPPQDHRTLLAEAASVDQEKKGTALPGGALAGLGWQLAEGLVTSTLRVAQLHFLRGTPKSADFYATQAFELAEDLASSRLMARALALRADVRLHWGKWEEADGDLDAGDKLVADIPCPEATELHRFRADLHLRAEMHDEAFQLCLNAQKSLEAFVSTAVEREAGQSPVKQQTPAKQLSPAQARSSYFTHPSPSPTALRHATLLDLVLPAVHAYLLRMQVHLLNNQRKADEIQRLLRRLSKLASLEEDKADELKLVAALRIQDLLVRCSSDPILGMLPDSVLSMPALGIAAPGAIVKVGTPRTGPTVLNSLKDIEQLLSRAIAFTTSRSQPAKLRELALLSASMKTLQASVGKSTKHSTAAVAHILDLATAVTLRREMLDAVEHKLADGSRHDDLLWPTISQPAVSKGDDPALSQLHALRDRYRLESAEPALTDSSMSTLLPSSWSAVSIHLTPEHDSLLLVRHRRNCEPLLFKLPLDRLARREGEDDAFTYDVASTELRDIIDESNRGTQEAKKVDGREERAAWWAKRKELDTRLGNLLAQMEKAWLGAFKSVFYDSRKAPPEGFTSFKARLERILKRSMVRASSDRKPARFKLDEAIVECLAALPSTSQEEDLEDLFAYAAESFHFSGVPLAHDETDVDQVVVDLREALEELHGTKSAPKRVVDPDEHTFLILDKTVQAFPWESLPCLRGRSISRLPSLAFLRDRLEHAATQSSSPDLPHDLVVNSSRASFVLNPGGDLKNTQKVFEPWLEEKRNQAGWTGIVGRAPLEEEVKAGLSQKELFLYFGHGGAEQYVRSQTVRHLPRCAITMLWGCSSGMLKDQGDFDPVGTPYHYMVAGCPTLVANLWDVTDKDIDKFAFSVFRKTGLAEPELPTTLPALPISLTAAVAQSRDVCNLRYLNGAAAVVYGIPVRFSSASSS